MGAVWSIAMTYRDVMILILCEASGKPAAEIRQYTEDVFKNIPVKTKIDDIVPDDKAQELLASLRNNLPGVRRWLVEGGMLAQADMAAIKGSVH